MRPASNVLYVGAGQFPVWYCDLIPRQQTNLCGAQANVFDHAVVLAKDDSLTHAKRLIGHEHYCPKQSLQRVLGPKCESHTTDAGACNKCRNGDAEILSYYNKQDRRCDYAERLGDDAD